MKKIRNKLINKLGRKGFTLIELLAVIVILALIMVIAIPNVLTSINSSRVSTLHSKAISVVEQYSNAYAADQLLPGGSGNDKAQLKSVSTSSITTSWQCLGNIAGFTDWAGLSGVDFVIDAKDATKCGTNGKTKCAVPSVSGTTVTANANMCSAIKKDATGKIHLILVGSKTGKYTSSNHVTYAYSEAPEGIESDVSW